MPTRPRKCSTPSRIGRPSCRSSRPPSGPEAPGTNRGGPRSRQWRRPFRRRLAPKPAAREAERIHTSGLQLGGGVPAQRQPRVYTQSRPGGPVAGKQDMLYAFALQGPDLTRAVAAVRKGVDRAVVAACVAQVLAGAAEVVEEVLIAHVFHRLV